MKILQTVLMICLLNMGLFAQDESASVEVAENEPAFSFTGSVDAYYRLNFSGSDDAAPGTSFANLPGFALGMANLIASHDGDKVGFTADLVFGPRGEDATFLSPDLRPGGSSNIVNQLFAYWNVSDAVTLTLGNFNTFLGYEVISPTGNFNYSTSYMFSYGPFSHSGLKMDASLGGGWSLMLGVLNPTDATEFNPSNEYFGGVQLGYEFETGGLWLNTLFDDDFFQVDLTAGVDVSETTYVGINATSASDAFYGFAGYLQIATSDNFKIGGRFEYFSDRTASGDIIGAEENVIDFTLSGNYTVGSLTIIPEFRIDIASTDVFADGDGVTDSLSSFVLAAVYGF